ncbi:hypothetical protein [Embleya sp. NPDC059237]|uniref:hypothetical protein n=1 Tax=unclassified Embleya TaxID=2699296 RepID=UPI0036B152EE
MLHRERTALIVDCEPGSPRPVLLRPIDQATPVIRLTRTEAQQLIDDTANLLDLLEAASDASGAST